MAKGSESQIKYKPKFVDKKIKFLLEVSTWEQKDGAGIDKKSPIDIKLNLNPDNRIIDIEESFATREHLTMILDRISGLLKKLDDRTQKYAEVLNINLPLRGKLGFSPDAQKGVYDDNFKPTFNKIDRIIYHQESPGVATVSYGRTYNGDMPPSKPKSK